MSIAKQSARSKIVQFDSNRTLSSHSIKIKFNIIWVRINEIMINNLNDIKGNKKWSKQLHFLLVGFIKIQLRNLFRENGDRLTEINEAYALQFCDVDGFLYRKNRNGEHFECLNCRVKADTNKQGSVNIFFRGAHSPSDNK